MCDSVGGCVGTDAWANLLLSATGPGNEKLMVGVRALHSFVLLGESLPHPALNEVT